MIVGRLAARLRNPLPGSAAFSNLRPSRASRREGIRGISAYVAKLTGV